MAVAQFPSAAKRSAVARCSAAAQLGGAEELEVALAVGSHGSTRDADGDDDRHREKGEKHCYREPSAGNFGTFRHDPIDEVGEPLVEPLGEVLFRIDGFGQFPLCRVVGSVTVDEDGRHGQGCRISHRWSVASAESPAPEPAPVCRTRSNASARIRRSV